MSKSIVAESAAVPDTRSAKSHPRSTTHSAWSAKDLDEAGIGEGLVRVSFGIEDWRDLLHDFERALETV